MSDMTGDTLRVRGVVVDRDALAAFILAHPNGSQEAVDALGLGDEPDPDLRCAVCGRTREPDRTGCRSMQCRSRRTKV